MGGNVSNAAIKTLLEEHVLPALRDLQVGQLETNRHLAVLNGRVGALEPSVDENRAALKEQGALLAKHETALAVAQVVQHQAARDVERVEHRSEREDDAARQDRQALWQKSWETAKTVAEIGAVLTLLVAALGKLTGWW